jgi:hypothetical protein
VHLTEHWWVACLRAPDRWHFYHSLARHTAYIPHPVSCDQTHFF